MIELDPQRAALVLIDLQNGIVGRPMAPASGAEIVEKSKAFAQSFRAAGGLVVLVHVGFSADMSDAPGQKVDEPMQVPPGGMPAGWMELAPGLRQPGDVVVLKRQWGAFHGTDLDLQLRRRGRTSIVLGGIATNYGVESTARQAWELGYELVIAPDLCASMSVELHEFPLKYVFPRLARIADSGSISLSA